MNKNKKIFVFLGLVFVVIILIIYILNIKNKFSSDYYQYIPIENWQNKHGYGVSDESIGVYNINVNSFVKINNIDNHFHAYSINEIENKLSIKLLNFKDIDFNYLKVFTISSDNETTNGFIENPAFVKISTNNYEDFECADFVFNISDSNNKNEIEQLNECQNKSKNRNIKRLGVQIFFATQYATEKQLNKFILYFSDFENGETEIHNSKKMNNKIFITRWNEYIFVYDNVIYIIDNSNEDYTKEELIKEIEKMEFLNKK